MSRIILWPLFLCAIAFMVIVSGKAESTISHKRAMQGICIDPTKSLPQDGRAYVLDWQDMMCAEHNARIQLMRHIASRYPSDQQPEFSEFLVPKDRLPQVFSRDVPLLRIVFPEKSFFNTARDQVRPEAMDALRIIAEGLRGQSPDVAVFVVGHTDNRGAEDYNYNLSVARAVSVSGMLRDLRIGPIAIWRVGFGEAVPLVENRDAESMALNRRVEFIIGARADPIAVYLEQFQPNPCSDRAIGLSSTCARKRRAQFDAVAVTQRTLIITQPNARVMPQSGERPGTVMREGHRALDVPAPNRIILRLVPQQRIMEVPRKF